MPSYDTKSGDKSTLAVRIDSSQTTNISISPMNINGSVIAWANTGGGVIEVVETSDSTLKREWIYYTGGVTNADSSFTLSGVVRGIARDSSDVTSGSASLTNSFSKGAAVRYVVFHDLLNKKANLDRVGTWTAAQTIADTVKWLFGASTNWIRGDGNDLKFKDVNNSEVTLSQLTAAAGLDEKAKVSSNDTTGDYLINKLTGGDGITVTETNDAGAETIDFDIDLDTDPGLEFDSGELRVKVKTDGGVTRDSDGLSVNSSFVTGLVPSSVGLYGTGSDGAPNWAAGASLDAATEKQYTTASIPSGQSVTTSSTNTVLVLHNTGNVTIDGTLTLAGRGGAAGAASSDGTAGASKISSFATAGAGNQGSDAGGVDQDGGGGSGGASMLTAGSAGSAGTSGSQAGGAASSASTVASVAFLSSILRAVTSGGGGGGGGNGEDGAGGAGGAGGGGFVWMIGGNLTLGASSVINLSGSSGSNGAGSPGGGGGGGGGGAGTGLIIVAGTITNGGVTLTVSGGSAGTGSNGGGNGGAGAAGRILIYSLSTGTLISS